MSKNNGTGVIEEVGMTYCVVTIDRQKARWLENSGSWNYRLSEQEMEEKANEVARRLKEMGITGRLGLTFRHYTQKDTPNIRTTVYYNDPKTYTYILNGGEDEKIES